MNRELQQYKSYYAVKYDYVDQLPTGWRLLPNIAIFQERIERGYPDEELLSVTIGRGIIKQTELDKKDSSTLDKSKYLLVYPNDLVYSMRFRQGASGYSHYKGIVSPACTVLKPRKGIKLNPRYFYYLFRTEFYKNYVERFSYGIADGQIPLRYTDFKRMYSIVPPLDIQNAIVTYLDKKNEEIEKFIRIKENLIKLLNEKKKETIRRFIFGGLNENTNTKFSGYDWIGSIPSHWTISRLKYEVKNLNSKRFPLEASERGKMKSKVYDYYGATGVIDKVDNYLLDETTILVAEDGANLVNRNLQLVFIATGKYWVNNHAHIIKPKKNIHLNYIANYLELIDYNPLIKGAAQPKLTKDAFMALPVIVPPMNEQIKIIDAFEEENSPSDTAIIKADNEISSIKEYRESLITDLITGQKAVPL